MKTALLSIQYLRAFAALMVVVYHAMRWTSPSFEIGAAGVDVFFVISGFILWTVAAERPVGAGRFLYKRWARVAPLYWILTLAVAAIAIPWPALIWDAKVDFPHLAMSLAFIQHLNADGQPFPVITAGWSLNYEAVFYLLFAASLLAPARWRFAALAAGLLAVPVFGFFYRPAWFLGANLMFLQFLAGAAFARWRLTRPSPPKGEGGRVGLLLLASGLALFAILAPLNLFEAIFRPLWWGAPAFLVVAGLVMVEDHGGLPNLPWLRLLGDASYSIYLAHVVAVQLLSHVFHAGRLWFIPIAIAVSIAAGLAVHFALERPLLAFFRGRSKLDGPAGSAQTAAP